MIKTVSGSWNLCLVLKGKNKTLSLGNGGYFGGKGNGEVVVMLDN